MPEWLIKSPTEPDEWKSYYRLRFNMLRKPWGQGSEDDRDPLDSEAIHGMIVDEKGQAIAVGRIHQIDPYTAQIRFMAVDELSRGKGFGKHMLDYLEAAIMKRFPSIETIILQARENAVPFYEHHGYQIEEKTFVLFGLIQHYLMKKTINKQE